MADLSERIEEVAGQDATVETDGLKVDAHNLKDLIAADNYLSKKAAAATPTGGIRLVRLICRGKYGNGD